MGTNRAAVLRRAPALLLAAGLIVFGAVTADAKSNWRSLRPEGRPDKVCVEVQGQPFDYCLLDAAEPLRLSVRGPRRLKIVTRYLFSPEDPEVRHYTLRVLMEGETLLIKKVRAHVLEDPAYCGGGNGDISALKRFYLEIPTGQHEVQLFAEAPPGGKVCARVFKESNRQEVRTVRLTPENYDDVCKVPLSNGKVATYYHFDADTPIRFEVKGPTNLKVYTRLDFTREMVGTHEYAIELIRDGESQTVKHYRTERLSSPYENQRELWPGKRKLLLVPVPEGTHRYEIRCIEPNGCAIACQIRIPEIDMRN